MEVDVNGTAETAVFDNIKGTHDALSVKRVFGDAYEVDGRTVIPVARIAGGAGGGGGSGESGKGGNDSGTGSGYGAGFGLGATPVGVYEMKDGELVWKPSIDVTRVVRGGQVLAGIIAVCATLIIIARGR